MGQAEGGGCLLRDVEYVYLPQDGTLCLFAPFAPFRCRQSFPFPLHLDPVQPRILEDGYGLQLVTQQTVSGHDWVKGVVRSPVNALACEGRSNLAAEVEVHGAPRLLMRVLLFYKLKGLEVLI